MRASALAPEEEEGEESERERGVWIRWLLEIWQGAVKSFGLVLVEGEFGFGLVWFGLVVEGRAEERRGEEGGL